MEAKKIKLEDINKKIKEDKREYISVCENEYKRQIFEVVDNVLKDNNIKFVLLAGPSSSGKTTTSKIMKNAFESCGRNVLVLSLDDFFVDRDKTPFWDDGEPNYETFDAIDWTLFSLCMQGLLRGNAVHLPTFDFVTGKKEFGSATIMEQSSVVIVEGLHALNPIIDQFIPQNKSYKVYISVNTDLFFDGEPYIEHQTIRMMRRLIRDVYRGKVSFDETKRIWQKVMIGENLYINPYIETSKYQINSFHEYEVCLYKTVFEQFESKIGVEDIVKKLEPLIELNKDVVPKNSVLQEFMPKIKE